MRRTPALILGGGPAGAAAAIRLSRADFRPLLVERTAVPGDALCGGFLSWRTLATLESLGVPPEALGGAPVRRVRLIAGKAQAEARLPAQAVGVSRHRLDALLIERAIAMGAAVERGAAARAIGHGVVRLADGGELRPEALLLATGKHDLRGLARPATARGRDPVLGLRTRIATPPALTRLVGDAIELHLFDRGYAGLVLHEDGSANLCMAVHRSRLDAAGAPETLLAELGGENPALGERLAFRTGAAAIDAVANIPYGWRATEGTPGLFRLGDQAAVIPSLAGEGIGIALASGDSAARALLAGGPGAATAWQHGFARRAYRAMAVAGVLRGLAESRAGARALVALARLTPGLAGPLAEMTRIRSIAD